VLRSQPLPVTIADDVNRRQPFTAQFNGFLRAGQFAGTAPGPAGYVALGRGGKYDEIILGNGRNCLSARPRSFQNAVIDRSSYFN
jgi:hypothetical protein